MASQCGWIVTRDYSRISSVAHRSILLLSLACSPLQAMIQWLCGVVELPIATAAAYLELLAGASTF